jgi:hypothetical protein
MRPLLVSMGIVLTATFGTLVGHHSASKQVAAAPQAEICIGSAQVGWGNHNINTPEICVPAPRLP